MVFSDLFFIFVFIPAFALTYLLATWLDKRVMKPRAAMTAAGVDVRDNVGPEATAPRHGFRLRNAALVVFSLLFYAWGEPIYIFLMLICVLINYLTGLGINGCKAAGRKVWLWIGVVADILILATFKYLGFFADTLGQLGLEVNAPRLALPIGISFYIFQSISYLVDVYRRDAPAQRNYFDLLLYISMFPQLIAGPIVRYDTVAREIHDRHVSAEDFAEGAYRFFIGLGKKVIFANILSEVSSGFLLSSTEELSVWGAWIGILAFTLQIYFDFSGYSDMAIGMGRAIGFHFNENFDHPYCCTSITDFWRRWHISLGSFFRDYAYIPLGGNRRHQMLNLLTVWFLTGMWHGASWNFILWGLYFGLILVIEKFAILKVARHIPTFLMRIWSLMLLVVGWAIFYFDNFDVMKRWFAVAFGGGSTEFGLLEETALTDNFWIWVTAILLCMPLRRKLENFADGKLRGPVGRHFLATTRGLASAIILVLCVALLVGATNNAFIYTRF
ncbi:MAG: MBOAT family protein [Muribaculaceae bacterium]|nr:MBOAT family protein [Muribaculaceae bacterium]